MIFLGYVSYENLIFFKLLKLSKKISTSVVKVLFLKILYHVKDIYHVVVSIVVDYLFNKFCYGHVFFHALDVFFDIFYAYWIVTYHLNIIILYRFNINLGVLYVFDDKKIIFDLEFVVQNSKIILLKILYRIQNYLNYFNV